MKPEVPSLADALEALAAYVRREEERARENMLAPANVAERLAVDQSTVYRLISQGELRGVRVAKGSIRVEPAELERFIRARRTRASLVALPEAGEVVRGGRTVALPRKQGGDLSRRPSPSDRLAAVRS